MSASDELIDSESAFADLVMQAQETDSPIIVLEGQYDYKLLGKHFSDAAIAIYAGGKKNIEKGLKLSNKINKDILFIADKDFDSIQNLGNIIYTEKHDLFIDILSKNDHILYSIAFDYLPNPGAFKTQDNISPYIVQTAIGYAHIIAKIRLAISKEFLPAVNLQRFSFQGSCTNPSDRDIFQLVSKRSNGEVDVESIELAVNNISKTYDAENFGLIGDHDLIAAFTKALIDRGMTPSNGKEIPEKIISSVHCALIFKTDVCNKIKEWCILRYNLNPYKCEIAT